MQDCTAGEAHANLNQADASHGGTLCRHYLLAKRSFVGQNDRIMKRYLLLLVTIVAAGASCSVFAQEKAALQSNATVVSLLQGSAGKSVELHLRSGEKMGGKIAQVTANVVHLSNLTGAEYFDAFVDVKDISAVVVRVAGR
jgi:hypothetical protein